MRLHRFLIDRPLASGSFSLEDDELLHQWTKVLRLQPGDKVLLLDGKGHEAEARIESLEKKRAQLVITNLRDVTAMPRRHVTLFCSVLKRENFEWVTEKATEVGVSVIVPVLAERTVKTGLRMDRLRKIAREAVEQCGRGTEPDILEPRAFADCLVGALPKTNILFHLGVSEETGPEQHGEVGVWIGPEGGWTEQEVQSAREKGFSVCSLGSLTLRAETAAIVAVSRFAM